MRQRPPPIGAASVIQDWMTAGSDPVFLQLRDNLVPRLRACWTRTTGSPRDGRPETAQWALGSAHPRSTGCAAALAKLIPWT